MCPARNNRQLPGQHPEQCRFAATVRSQQSHPLATGKGQIDGAQMFCTLGQARIDQFCNLHRCSQTVLRWMDKDSLLLFNPVRGQANLSIQQLTRRILFMRILPLLAWLRSF